MQLYAGVGQQSAALRQYEMCVQTLQDELGVAPAAETLALYEQIRHGGITTVKSQIRTENAKESTPEPVARHNLPASTTPFIGRVQEVAALTRFCQDEKRRLITILGPGGIGKTRLALEVASHLVDGAAHALFFVRLAHLNDPANIISTVATALNLEFHADGRSPEQQLHDYLQQKQILLVLDNFEHLLDGVPLIQELLQNCPSLRLLITSRERLQLMGETVFTLGSLSFPTGEMPPPLEGYLEGYNEEFDAIQLFVETAQRLRPNEPLHVDGMHAVAEICRLVGGMPLGILLAASWIEVLSPAEIAAELSQGFDLLEKELRDLPERQQSMRAVLTYSWQRLTEAEQAVFMRLALFRGGFTRAAAEEIAGASLSILARLVDKSFVQRTSGRRYDVHELVRQYAEQQLKAAGFYAATEAAHGATYLNFLQQCEQPMAGSTQLQIILELEADFENIRSAWLWAVATNHYQLVDHALDGLFRWFWLRRSRQQEALALLIFAQQQWAPLAGERPQPVWGRILARIMEQQGPWLVAPATVIQRVEQALALAHQQSNQAEIIFCKWAIGLASVSNQRDSLFEEDYQLTIQLYQECVDAYRKSGDQFRLAQTLESLGHCYRRIQRYDLAPVLLHESLDLRRALGDRFGIARSVRELGFVTLLQGLERETEELWQAAYELQCELGDQQGIIDSRFFPAILALSSGDWQRAKTIAEHVIQLAAEMNNSVYQEWASRALVVAICMEEHPYPVKGASSLFSSGITPFTAGIPFMIFTRNWIALRNQLQRLLALATSELEIALCLPFIANLLAQVSALHKATRLLALGFRYPEVAEGWMGHLPEIVTLQHELRSQLPPDEFARAWEQGQALDLRIIAAELPLLLASSAAELASS